MDLTHLDITNILLNRTKEMSDNPKYCLWYKMEYVSILKKYYLYDDNFKRIFKWNISQVTNFIFNQINNGD